MSTLSKLTFRASIFAAVLALVPFAPAAHAQDLGMFAKVNVPFAFESGNQHYAAGTYSIRMENQHTLLIKGVSQSGLTMTSVEDNGQPEKRGVAVFQKFGDRYFLTEISVTGKSRHIRVQATKEQKQSQLAQSSIPSTPVELALLTAR